MCAGCRGYDFESTEEQAVFCYLPLSKPHPPYCVEEDYYNAIDPGSLPRRIQTPEGGNLPPILDAMRAEYRSKDIPEETWLEIRRIYYAMCAKIDALFGMVVDALQRAGMYDDTWIFFFSDHGDFTGDYALPEKTHATLQDCLLRVPLVIKPPSNFAAESGTRNHLTELVDVTATIYDALGIDPGYYHQGLSLCSSLAGGDDEIRNAVYAEVGARRNEESFINKEVHAMPPDSFYRRHARATHPVHRAGSHAVMCRTHRYKYIHRYYTQRHELYDLDADPAETNNICGTRGYARIEREMKSQLLDFFVRTVDVLPYDVDSRKI